VAIAFSPLPAACSAFPAFAGTGFRPRNRVREHFCPCKKQQLYLKLASLEICSFCVILLLVIQFPTRFTFFKPIKACSISIYQAKKTKILFFKPIVSLLLAKPVLFDSGRRGFLLIIDCLFLIWCFRFQQSTIKFAFLKSLDSDQFAAHPKPFTGFLIHP
jgi:hypothetical protein